VKEQVLNAGDTAALAGLLGLAGVVGIPALFALIFKSRRDTAYAAFEMFAIVAVLVAAATSAGFCLVLLHQNRPLSDRALAQTGTPLLVGVCLLAFVFVLSRTNNRTLTLFPLACTSILVAAEAANLTWTVPPEKAGSAAVLILGFGGIVGLTGWGIDRLDVRSRRRQQYRFLKRLYDADYILDSGTVRLELPRGWAHPEHLQLRTWTKKGRLFVDMAGIEALRKELDVRWRAYAWGEAQLPHAPRLLMEVRVRWWMPKARDSRVVQIAFFSPRDAERKRVLELRRNGDGLFDITDAGIVD
jgi:hypothetical protein